MHPNVFFRSPAAEILQSDFISPFDMFPGMRGYGAGVLGMLTDTMPPPEALLWMRDNGYALIGPPSYLPNLKELVAAYPRYFDEATYANFHRASEVGPFARPYAIHERLGPGWLAIRKGTVPGSLNKKLHQQNGLLARNERIVTAVEFVWAVIAFRLARRDGIVDHLPAPTPPVIIRSYGRTATRNTNNFAVAVMVQTDGRIGTTAGYPEVKIKLTGLFSALKDPQIVPG